MNGKKFTAAERHFEKKRFEYEKRIKFLRVSRDEYASKLAEANRKIEELTSENNQLIDWVDRLLEYTELSKEDIQRACQKDQQIAQVATLLLSNFRGFI